MERDAITDADCLTVFHAMLARQERLAVDLCFDFSFDEALK
jgi:hypothetical protein